jgi:mono/diheme cytochrome c family protein
MADVIKQAGFAAQPNAFPSATIEAEVAEFAPGEPAINVPSGASATWNTIYQAAADGQFIAAPYHDVKITDPAKLAAMTAAYQAVLGGARLTRDVRDVFLDSGLADMGFAAQSEIRMDGRALLVQQCQQCHNARLDPTLTRDKFLVDKLDQMSRDEKDTAIARIRMSVDTRFTMPPPLFRTVSQAQRDAMISELAK